ncbi:ABC transporter permease [Halomonas nitroreducens]|uniref:ABC transporter permease n=1 Tax=Halomonas nitroreducens TaxID=447425 RepID=A0A3S0HRN2_9GAMM|nr:ABC transporter permease [Halomonas nitroreducens]RTR05922.1 ABC transporter permease [Halomonas nitroreducens]
MESLRRIFALAVKELLAILKDRKSRFVLIGPPIIQLIVFGYAATFDLNDIAFAVYNEDRGVASRDLIARVAGSPHFHRVADLEHDGQIAPLLDNREVLLVLRLGPRFSADLQRGRSASAQLLIDGRNSNTALLALGYLRTIVSDFNSDWATRNGRPGPPAALQVRHWFNAGLASRWFVVPGIVGLLTLVITTVVTALSVAREREAGTFDQLQVTPLRPVEILIGKSVPGILIGLVEGSFILLMTVVWFEVPLRGSLGALYLGMFLFLLSAVGIGLMISSLAVTQQQGILGAFLFLVPSVILSGFATPIANMPPVVQWLTLINPLRYFLVVLRGVFLEGDSYALLFNQYWPMLVIGMLTLAMAGWLFRHRRH